MSYYAAGLIAQHLHELHPRLAHTTRLTLIAMATFVGETARDRAEPVCFASQASIAQRSGLRVRATAYALRDAESCGLIARDGKRTLGAATTIRWAMPVLVTLWAREESRKQPARLRVAQ